MKTIEIDEKTFKSEVLESKTPVLVDFYAPWCGPCRSIAPVIEELAVEYKDRIKFVKINTDENEAEARRYKIASIPTLLLFYGGEVVAPLGVGVKSKSELKQALDAFLAQSGSTG